MVEGCGTERTGYIRVPVLSPAAGSKPLCLFPRHSPKEEMSHNQSCLANKLLIQSDGRPVRDPEALEAGYHPNPAVGYTAPSAYFLPLRVHRFFISLYGFSYIFNSFLHSFTLRVTPFQFSARNNIKPIFSMLYFYCLLDIGQIETNWFN